MISSKILIPLTITIACILALIVGTNLAVDAEDTIVYSGAFLMVILLVLFARDYWWIALFIAVGFGGFLYFGFKIYAHEGLLALALIGLIPSVAMNPRSRLVEHRPKIPWFVLGTFIYLLLHVFYSIAISDAHGFIEFGNIVRAYMYGLWPLLFIILFRWYGRTDFLPFAIYLLQSIYLFRALLTLATLLFPTTSVLPGINFILPGNQANAGGLDDLRYAGHGICVIACAVLLGKPRFTARVYQWLLLAFAAFVQLLGGGRGMLIASIVAVLAAAAASRMWKSLFAAGVVAATFITFLNLFPESIEGKDPRIQRTLSILIFDSGATSAQRGLERSSDLWHQRIQQEGYDRWTYSPKTFAIGTGIQPWDQTTLRETDPSLWLEAMVRGAADIGNYEAALWAILAPTGLLGFGLYVFSIGYFAVSNGRRLLRDNLSGMDITVAFLGCYPAFEWLLFSPVQGGYPQIELLFAVTAFYYFCDRKGRLRSTAEPVDEASLYSEEGLG